MSPQAGVLLLRDVAPRIEAVVHHSRSIHCIGAECTDELAQDTIAHACKILHQAEANGKKVAASSVAYYALQHTKSGRRSVGHSNSDVLGSATQINGRSTVRSLQQPVPIPDESGLDVDLIEMFEHADEDPFTLTARKLDWQTFMASLNQRARAVITCLIEGGKLTSVAQRFGVSLSTIMSQKKQLAKAIKEFMGEDILMLVTKKPEWRNCLVALRERQLPRPA